MTVSTRPASGTLNQVGDHRPDAIVVARGLSKRFGDQVAVDALSFEIRAGEIFSLLGPNGAGKSTTIAMLATLVQATAGDALIDGHSIRTDPMAVRRVIGMVPQEIALYDDLSARENLLFWGRMYGLGGRRSNSVSTKCWRRLA